MKARNPLLEDGGPLTALLFRRLGDSLLATPALRSLKLSFPKLKVRVVCEPQVSRVFEHLVYVNEIAVVSKSPGVLELSRAIRNNDRRPAVTVDFLSDPRTAIACLFSRAGIRAGISKSWKRAVYSRSIQVQDELRPEYSAIHKLRLAQSLGADVFGFQPDFCLKEENVENAEKIVNSLSPNGESIVSLYVTSRRDYKKWPIENFKQIVHSLRQRHKIALVGGIWESDEITAFSGFAGLNHDAVILFDDLGDFGAFLRKSILFVGNDGGPKHLATAVGTATVGIFLNDPWEYWTPPNSKRHLAVGGRGITPQVSDVLNAIENVLSYNA